MSFGFDKRKILLEMVLDIPKYIGFIENDLSTASQGNLLFKNKFSLHLEGVGVSIEPSKIRGFSFLQENELRTFSVTSSLFVDEWIHDFQNVCFARLVFYDRGGNMVRFMEYDLGFSGYKMECDYSSNVPLTPVFNYEIFD